MKINTRKSKNVLLCFVLILFYGCGVNFSTNLIKTNKPVSQESAYIYGRLYSLSSQYSHTFALQLENVDSKKLENIKFSTDDSGRVIIQITPGSYLFKKVLFIKKDNLAYDLVGEKDISEYALKIKIKSGEAYYIGDWLGIIVDQYGHIYWKITKIVNSYDVVTQSMRVSITNFDKLNCLNMLFVLNSEL